VRFVSPTPFVSALLILSLLAAPALAKKKPKPASSESQAENEGPWKASTFSGLELRGIGPALTSGRIGDFAVHPENHKIYYVAVASGGVWKTINSGTTWTPIFDGESSYSIGCITLDPNNPNVLWVGTGENNSQRSVGYGDGVYKSLNGGKTWKKMGLENSEHIGKIVVDPRDSDTVFVAAQGPLWSAGGDRGLYKTTDGGETWKKVLGPSEHTGVSEVVMDPRDPDLLYATTYQRRRHVWTLINGGPESGIHKSTDGGETWRKVDSGLPSGDVGRIGITVSPAAPDVVYAIVEAAGDGGGFFRSTDRGETWEKRSKYVSGSPQYYQEIFADPVDVDRVYSMDVWMQVTENGGKSFQQIGETHKHVDNHALWIDPEDTDYLLSGCDGGIYETFDRGATWHFKANLPITQFYKASADNATPFYNVYGGTQDNFSLAGPSRTDSEAGITNADWFVTRGGDGFETLADPEDPNIVYAQAQHGRLARFDGKTGERLDIQPQPAAGELGLRWNWDAPLVISPHSASRLYFAANILFRSDDRGSTWKAVSGDLSRQLDRNELEVMGRVWGVDSVSKNRSTSFYGNIVALDESPLVEGLLYVGTDDGLVHVSENGGESWRPLDRVPGVPERTYVNALVASSHDPDTVFGAFNNHKKGDFQPYLLKSEDRGLTWKSIASNLPERGSVYDLAEDHENPDLLFAGTEFGVFFSAQGGSRWVQLKGGIPTVAARDLEIQKRENDLVVGTFGRGFYILDDYTPLRGLSESILEEEAALFSVKDAWAYVPRSPLGLPGKSFQGDSFYVAPNPPFGAIFTYYLKDGLQTLEKQRQEQEKKLADKGEDVAYPSWDALRKEAREPDPMILLTVRDDSGAVVRRLTGPTSPGMHRVAWDLRGAAPDATSLKAPDTSNPFASQPMGPLTIPGTYSVELAKKVGNEITSLGEKQSFRSTPLGAASLPAPDRDELEAFLAKTARLYRALEGALGAADEAKSRLEHVKKALLDTPAADLALLRRAEELANRLRDLEIELEGDAVVSRRYESTPPSISDRVSDLVSGHWETTSAPTATQRQAYRIAGEAFEGVLARLRVLMEQDLAALEGELEAAGGPWTPGRIPHWEIER